MKTTIVKIYSQKRISQKGNKGWIFTYVEVLGDAISTEKTEEVWIKDKEEAILEFMLNKSIKL